MLVKGGGGIFLHKEGAGPEAARGGPGTDREKSVKAVIRVMNETTPAGGPARVAQGFRSFSGVCR